MAVGIYSNFFLSIEQKVVKRTVMAYSDNTYEFYYTPLSSNVFGVLLQVGCDYKLKNRTLFSNIRICRTALKEAGVATIVNSANLSLGMYLTKDK